jgi:tRNA(Ile)-lysidine synthase
MARGAKGEGELRRALRAGVPSGARLLLAVSGGRDSMVLLDAMRRWAPAGAVVAVASFDHGTGPAARRAVAVVRRAARAVGWPLLVGRARGLPATEAAWRAARWAFLREVAAEQGARVVTAHTRDDQVETVFHRALRGSGPRGLAGLYAPSDVLRPLLHLPRGTVAAYAAAAGVDYVEDPSNASRAFLRNRIRLDLLPACERVRPGFADELLALAREAAAWRASVEALAAQCAPRAAGGSLFVDVAPMLGWPAAALGPVWAALAARAGIALDRRGTERLVAFTHPSAVGARIPLAGGHVVRRHAATFEIRSATGVGPAAVGNWAGGDGDG